MTIRRGTTFPVGRPAARDRLLTRTESPGDLVIRARHAYDDVVADPDRFRPAAEALVAEARRARQPEALARALRAMAWAERLRLDGRSAIRLLDEACRIARRHHLDDTLGELLMSHAAVSQELGRLTAAQRDLRAAAMLVTGAQTSELDFHQSVLLQNIGRLDEAAVIYHRVLSDPAAAALLLPEAAAAAQRGMEEFSAAGVPLMAAEAQLRVAQLAMLAGDCTEAVAASTAAAAAFRRQTRATWRARCLLVKAEARLKSGTATTADMDEARAAAERLGTLGTTSAAVQGFLVTGRLAASLGRRRQAIAALTRAGSLARGAPVLVRLRGRVASALAAGLRDRDHEALAHCRRGLGDLARHRDRLPSVELRALASGHGAELGLIGLDVVIRDGSPARVLNWMERRRAAALLAVEPPVFDEISEDLTALRAVHPGRPGQRTQSARPASLAYRAGHHRAGRHRGPDPAGHLAGESRRWETGRPGNRWRPA
jgi:tetratricopeptide (TPR) repeat protein